MISPKQAEERKIIETKQLVDWKYRKSWHTFSKTERKKWYKPQITTIRNEIGHHCWVSQCHFPTFISYVTFWVILSIFHIFHYYYICYYLQWVIFDVTSVIILECHKPSLFKTVNLMNVACVDCSTSWLFLSYSFLQASVFPKI